MLDGGQHSAIVDCSLVAVAGHEGHFGACPDWSLGQQPQQSTCEWSFAGPLAGQQQQEVRRHKRGWIQRDSAACHERHHIVAQSSAWSLKWRWIEFQQAYEGS